MFKKIFNKNVLPDFEGRPLTGAEKKLAESVFGDDIDYNKVKVYFRRYLVVWPNKRTSMAPAGNIYFCSVFNDLADMSETPRSRAHFIHEMAHVWQYQKGVNLRIEATKLMFKHKFNYQAAYDYRLDKVEDFKKLNIEQQASIVEHYYACTDKLADLKAKGEPEEDMKDLIKEYKTVLKGHIPTI